MFEFIVLTPPGCADPASAIAASRAGAIGLLDLQFTADTAAALGATRKLADAARGRWGVLVDAASALSAIREAGLNPPVVAVAGHDERALEDLVRHAKSVPDVSLYAVATSVPAAQAAEAAGADAIIGKGHETGGWVGQEGSFVLLQRLLGAVQLPVWVHGGIGIHTVRGAVLSGARGAVLDGQVLLARESPLDAATRAAIEAMDGSETITVGQPLGAPLRIYSRPGLTPPAELIERERELELAGAAPADWREAVAARVGAALDAGVLAIGQDAAFARGLATRFHTVGGILGALRDSARDAPRAAAEPNPLAEDAPLARSHGTRYPFVQGPMTRVSDRAEFAAAIADAGALPFLALALMRGGEADALLSQTSKLLGDRPWGAGILGFVPAELRAEQLAVVKAHRPPFALIAGGRPDQAQELEAQGIATYLHVPSPGLLKLFLAQGARRFVFEGRECGGHVGPRASFVLWESMLETLLEELPTADTDCHILFAGGIHDARSAAMVAATAGQATARGVRIGTLLGTAYLFTQEATAAGAITDTFQRAAVDADGTALLESGPGHATRCLRTPFVEQFASEKRALRQQDVSSEELRARLEQLNIGRLRIAAKGVDRNPDATEPDAPKLIDIDPAGQWDRGLYMIGEVASMHSDVTTVADLHDDLARGSSDLLAAAARSAPAARPTGRAPAPAEVAIVGMACILPGAPDVDTLWANILGKVDAIREVPRERWDADRMFDPDQATPDKVYSRWGGFIDPVEFDPIAFGLPPRSLTSIEPFQLLALLTAQAALNDAGYGTRPFDRERASVILGAGGGGADLSVGYTVRSALPSLLGDGYDDLHGALLERLPEWTEDSFPGLLMNVAAGRIANRLDLGGTNYTVDAACASSLTAITLGTRELALGTSDMVLAGGVDAIQNPFAFLCFAKTHALSPRGRCRPFDATADGIAISEGFATLVLKRLADAERDGDRIYAVIRGVGAASDGRDRSLTAPRPEGQMRALRRAYAQADVSPASIGLVEAHGTGTVAGDAAEVASLTEVFAEHAAAPQSCAIGSVKSMIGHTKATAGVAGMIKAALALHHRVLPPTIGVTEPNPKLTAPDSPFYVNTEARPWLAADPDTPRRAGVSAFGFGGTDFHIVLEEYTDDYLSRQLSPLTDWPGELLVWRGSREQIIDALTALEAQLEDAPDLRLIDLAGTVNAMSAEATGTATLTIVAESVTELPPQLAAARELLASGERRAHRADGIHWAEAPLTAAGELAFLFPGQGSQTVDMGRELAIAFPEAREAFEQADRALADHYEDPLSRRIFPPPAFTVEQKRRQSRELTDTHVAQPALGATECAYLRVLEALGVSATMAAGHSYGELVALHAAGVIDDDQLLDLSEARGRAMAEAAAGATGAMAAVDAGPDALAGLLDEIGVVAANLNAPAQTVLSGPADEIEAAIAWCAARDIRARALPVACAFHSPQVAGAQQAFAAVLGDTAMQAPAFPVYSNTTGERHTPDPESLRAVLAEQIGQPVQFVREVEAMHRDGGRVFLEVGPRSVLSGLVSQILGDRDHLAVPVDRPGRPALLGLLDALAVLLAEGVAVRTERLLEGRAWRRLDLHRLAASSAESVAPHAWLIDGGGARPADSPRVVPMPVPPPKEQSIVTHSASNGSGTLAPLPSVPHEANGTSPPDIVAPTAPPPRSAPVTGDRAADVMTHYQQVMRQFLETQQAVMLSYLGAPRPASPGPSLTPAPVLPPATIGAPAVVASPAVVITPPPAAAAPPAAAQAEPPLPSPSPGAVVLDAQQIEQRLLAVVSERTGYPADMLGLDADLEGDLGVDSIKRVEIAGTFTQGLEADQRGAIDIEQLTASRTLREVIIVLQESLAAAPRETGAILQGTAAIPRETAAIPQETASFRPQPAETEERIGRFVLHAASAPARPERGQLAERGAIVIVGDETALGESLSGAVAADGDAAVLLPPESVPRTEDEASGLAAWLQEQHGAVKALVYCASPAAGDNGGLEALLLLTKALRQCFEAAVADGGAAVVGVTRLGGAFGLGGTAPAGSAGHGAVSGFLKSLAREWPALGVKLVDLEPDVGEAAAEWVRHELRAGDGVLEVGYRDGTRTSLELRPAALAEREAHSLLDADSVVLLTGGARGITAEVAVALAERHRPRLVLIGRTPLDEERDETARHEDIADVRRALIEARRATGRESTPAQIEAECQRIFRVRELRRNLARIQDAGAGVEYLVCDVADDAALSALIDDVYARLGRIDGVIHGAGVIEDRLIRDKQLDSLRRVMTTKAGAAATLARVLRPQELRFLCLFSSVSGRFGNRGQADYAAASEVLSKLAEELDARWDARVVSINWGPWRSRGMVSPALEAEFARRGVTLIPTAAGCQMLIDELARGRKGEAEVVVGAAESLDGAEVASAAGRLALLAGAAVTQEDGGTVMAARRLTVGHDRYLDHHRVDGNPVFPFAAAMEMMAEVGLAANPIRPVTGLRAIRLLKGITVPDGDAGVGVIAAAQRSDSPDETDVSISAADTGRVHYRATALRHRSARPDGDGAPAAIGDLAAFPMSIEDAYRELLFHGPLFQAIRGIDGLDQRGASARLEPSDPAAVVSAADGLRWLLDPVLIDGALQVQVLWARLQWDVTLLPAEIGGYERYDAPRPGEIVRHELRIRPESAAPMCHCDHWFLGPDGRLIATLTNVVGVGTRALNRLAAAQA